MKISQWKEGLKTRELFESSGIDGDKGKGEEKTVKLNIPESMELSTVIKDIAEGGHRRREAAQAEDLSSVARQHP